MSHFTAGFTYPNQPALLQVMLQNLPIAIWSNPIESPKMINGSIITLSQHSQCHLQISLIFLRIPQLFLLLPTSFLCYLSVLYLWMIDTLHDFFLKNILLLSKWFFIREWESHSIPGGKKGTSEATRLKNDGKFLCHPCQR